MENFLKLCQNLRHIYPYRPGRFDAPKHWRYNLRSFLNRGSIRRFEQFINQHPFLVDIFNTHLDYSYPVACRFLDKRSTIFYFYPKNLPHFLRRYGKNH